MGGEGGRLTASAGTGKQEVAPRQPLADLVSSRQPETIRVSGAVRQSVAPASSSWTWSHHSVWRDGHDGTSSRLVAPDLQGFSVARGRSRDRRRVRLFDLREPVVRGGEAREPRLVPPLQALRR